MPNGLTNQGPTVFARQEGGPANGAVVYLGKLVPGEEPGSLAVITRDGTSVQIQEEGLRPLPEDTGYFHTGSPEAK